jgi:hypothetical protein
MRYLFFVFIILLVWGCDKDKKDENQTFALLADTSSIMTGDSIQLRIINAPGTVQFSIAPQAGRINNSLQYIAPSSLASDSLVIMITATSIDKIASIPISIYRRNNTDTLFTFSQHIMPLLVSSCNFQACHGNGSRAGGVSLETYDSVAKHVIPFQPTLSRFYNSIIKTDPLRRMPPAGNLHKHQIARVYGWIEQGALNN